MQTKPTLIINVFRIIKKKHNIGRSHSTLFKAGYWWMLQNHEKFGKHHYAIVDKNKYKVEQVVGHKNSDKFWFGSGC